MKKIISIFIILTFALSVIPAFAAKPSYKPKYMPELLEATGNYDVPGHPNLKVHVFVHDKKPGKPGPAPTPVPIVCSDPSVNNVIGATGWHLPQTFTYNLNLSSAPALVTGLATITQESFASWTNAISGKVTMIQGENTELKKAAYDGKNIIAWGRTSPSALGVTYTWYDRYTGVAVDVDTIMNNRYSWTSGACYANSYDAQNILTHELGHWFGLNDHYTADYIDNTMFGYGSRGEIKKNTPEFGDISGLQAIYQ